jgi:hypothetical protein
MLVAAKPFFQKSSRGFDDAFARIAFRHGGERVT